MSNIEQVFDNLGLSEETVLQIKTIFEAAVSEKVKAEKEDAENQTDDSEEKISDEAVQRYAEYLHEQYEAKGAELVESYHNKVAELQESHEAKLAELQESNEAALKAAISEWISENTVQVSESIKTQRLAAFAEGMRNLFLEHGIDIPDAEYSLAEETSKELSAQLAAIQEENASLKGALNTLNEEIEIGKRASIFSQVTEGLSEMQVERLKSLSESLKAETAEEYQTGLNTLKEAFLKPAVTSQVNESVKPVAEKGKNPLTEAVALALRGKL